MRKLFFILAACVLFGVTTANAQSGFGIKAGLNFNSMSDVSISNLPSTVNEKTGFHFGVLYKLKLPLGLALQPELLYTQKSSTISGAGFAEKIDNKVGYLQLPVNLQWGIDLVLFRPFVAVAPYIGYAVTTKTSIEDFDYKKLQYGVGCGVGLEIWKLQITGKYNWDMGEVGSGSLKDKRVVDFGKNKGFELSLAVIF